MKSLKSSYYKLVSHYEKCFETYGTSPKGVDWPNAKDLNTRFAIMLEVCQNYQRNSVQLLDLGCGYGALLSYLQNHDLTKYFNYRGIDLSPKLIGAAKLQHEEKYFEVRDILIEKLPVSSFDYIIMNGLFTEKRELLQNEMEKFFIEMIKESFNLCRLGIAFNVMNYHAEWLRDDLFYLPFDQIVSILKQEISRHLVIRMDYGLFEYTVYAYKQPNITSTKFIERY